ncbi:MAG: PAS domain-containing sensor histidine kinase [Gammaproteobacteria bacterium]|nr:PAS domain-containing sensor histidine kinase [Gammaproteobacteria bacterium]
MSELSQFPVSPTTKKSLLGHSFGGFFWGIFTVAVLYWCLDAWLVASFHETHSFFVDHEQHSFLVALLNPGEDHLTYRVITAVTFLLLGMAISGYVGRLNQAKLKLQESHAWLDIMSDASFEGLSVSENGIVVAVNKQICERLGYTPEELIGRSILEMTDPGSHPEIEEQLASETEGLYVIEALHKDGQKVCLEVRARNLKIDGRSLRVSALWDITQRLEDEKNLRNYERRLRTMTSRLALAEEKVRRDIAIALHDTVAQQLSLARQKIGAALQDTSDEDSTGSLSEANELIDSAIRETRTLVFDLSPPVLYELGFVAAVEWFSDVLSERYGIECSVKMVGGELLLDHDLRVTIYQLVRELMINVTKHSGAKFATVSIADSDGMLTVEVKDNGCGFDVNSVGSGFGLFSIRERLNSLDGRLNIESEVGQGTAASICIPLGEWSEANVA